MLPSLLVTGILCLGISTLTSAEIKGQSLRLEINGQEKIFSQPPIMDNDVTLVPMRAIFEELGAEVKWNGDQQKITATKKEDTIELKLGSKDAFINYEPIRLLQEPKTYNNTTMVPIRFIGESFGANVEWNAKTKTVSINFSNEKTAKGKSNLTIASNSTNIAAANSNETDTNTEIGQYTLQQLVDQALMTNSKVKAGNAQVDRSEEIFKKSEDNVDYIPSGNGNGIEDSMIRNAFIGYHQATISYEMAQKQQEIIKESITYAVKKAYNEVHQAKEQYKIAKAAVDYAAEQNKIAFEKEKLGILSSFDFNQAAKSLTELKKKQDVAEQSINDAYEHLNLLLGFNLKNRYKLANIPPIGEFEVEDLDTQVARVLKDSTSVWLAEQQITIAKLNVDLYTFNNPTSTDTYKTRNIDVKIKEYEKANTKQQLEETTRNIFYNIDKLKSQYEILETQVAQAEESLKLTKVKFDSGMGIAIDLKGAQLQVDQLKQQMFDIVAQLDYLKMAYEKPWVAGGF